ncbi:MAG: UvrD-helicase domain-containing protein, partial [Bacteroidales bacterium]|nr:UvrD-helicase domain-containing protein [Bacteroidales bacterium]
METTKVIHLEKANTLAQFLSYQERREVVSLKITGFIGRKDFEDVLDDMCEVWGLYDDDDNFIPEYEDAAAIKHLDLGEAIYVDGDNLPHFGFHTQIETFILPQGLKSTLDGGEFETGLCGADTLKTLVLPQGLKTVGGFCACENLEELVLPEGLEVIESNAFTGCDSITSIRIPASVEELYGSSFAGCNIEAYEVDEGNEHYTAIDGVVYTKDLKTLVAFPSAYPHKHFVVPSTTQVIGDGAFMDSKIESVDLPNGLSTIEYWAFEGASIRSIEIPDTVTEEDVLFLEGLGDMPSEFDRHRADWLCALYPAAPWSIIAITFTNKAANELKERLSVLLGPEAQDVWAMTFHSACCRILRRDIERMGYERSFTIYDSADSERVMKDIIKDMGLDDKTFPAKVVLGAISKEKDHLTTPEELLERAEQSNDLRLLHIARAYQKYQKRLKENNALDFDDIICVTVRLLQEHEDIRTYYQRKFRYVLVDEYQDTNHVQYLLTSLLAGGHENICVVGDDDQSIYRFRGATIEN